MSNLSKCLCLAVAAGLFVLYASGLNGIFFIDDAPSLDGLTSVQDFSSAMQFITTGTSGPLGRPLALASFLIGAESYPQSAWFFLLVNILVHLCNVLLVALLAFRLQVLQPRLLGDSRWFAPAVAGLWGVLPILASTSLMVIQRMTSLSALFVLLGVNLYLGYRMGPGGTRRAMLALLGVGGCTVLATLSKENGVLLPPLLLTMHLLLDRHTPSATRLMNWGLWLPSLLLLSYLLYRMPTIANTYWQRPFDLWERLATQPIILWEYLRVAFLPNVMALSPYRDDYPIYRFTDTISVLALGAWALALLLAIWLRLKKHPLLLFALTWFLVGHMLESTMFSLFLYFEHRNYLPLLGPVLAIVAVFQRLPVPSLHKGLMASSYLAFLAFMLWQAAAMWGGRQQLVWAQAHPDSPRAVQMLATAYLQAGRLQDADLLYERTLERNPRLTSVAVQGLRLSCYAQDDGARTAFWLSKAKQALPNGLYSALTLQSLESVGALILDGRCQGLEADDVRYLVQAMERNAVFGGGANRARLAYLQAQMQLHQGRPDLARQDVERALAARSDDVKSITLLYQLTWEQDGEDAARHFLAKAAQGGPVILNPWVLRDWEAAMKQIGTQKR